MRCTVKKLQEGPNIPNNDKSIEKLDRLIPTDLHSCGDHFPLTKPGNGTEH